MPHPQVMGILNITPDSFFSGSRKQTEREIAERTNQIIAEGGTMIDVGACSTRPGSLPVSEEEEMARLRRGLEIVRHEQPSATLSVDTYRPSVARMVVEEFGADIINDISEGGKALTADITEGANISGMFEEVARLNVQYILMSVQPTMETMIANFRTELAQLHALGHDKVILDPGYGFGKDVIDGNYAILSRQQELKDAFPTLPLLVGISRKRMIWQLSNSSPEEALNGTTAVNMLALERGADILRVHDVKEAVEAVRIYDILRNQ